MKKLIKIILTISFMINASFLFINPVFAATTATIYDKEGLNVRNAPTTDSKVISVLSYKSTVTLVSTKKHSGKGCDAKWYQINYGGSTDRYICSEQVVINNVDTSSNGKYYTSTSFNTRIVEDYANVRKSASFSSEVIEKIFLGTKVTVLSESGDWYKISYYNGKTGYVLKKLCKNYDEITKTNDASYNQELKNANFPESYWPFLSYLHSIHPNWKFIADKTEKNFDDAVIAEVGKNYIQSTIDSFRIDAVPKEGSYYTASPGVVAVYLDPRNYLNESSIFAFEALSYNSATQTNTIVKNIFGDSYLAEDEYVNAFMNAGKTYKISPVHLATRVKQEGGANEDYESVSGKSNLTYNGNSLNGYYNYYNIGAYGSYPITQGLAVAAGLIDYGVSNTPWDTREKAITYGAKWIADGYISKGQDTRYYQKFNTKKGAYNSPYTHQYMTNILAPASESLSTYESYKSLRLLDISYTFYIPVYNNMPNDFTVMPPIGDTNNSLKDLKINNQTLIGFDSDVLEYTSYVPYDTTKVNISATLESKNSSITGTGEITLKDKEQTINIAVTSQTGETKIYKITIIKQDAPDDNGETSLTPEEIINKMDVKFSNGYMSYIKSNTTATTLINDILEIEPKAKITITNNSGVNKTNTILATGDTITVNSSNKTKKYNIVIKGDTNGDGLINSLDLLRIQKHILKYSLLTGVYKDACDNNYDNQINSLDLLRTQKHILKYIILR